MAKLEEAFHDPDRVGPAYAESASLVEYLVRRSGEGVIAKVLGELREGADFPTALHVASGLTPSELEAAWLASMRARWLFAPDLNTLLWLGMVVLLFIAFVRMLRQRRRKQDEAETELAAGYDDDE